MRALVVLALLFAAPLARAEAISLQEAERLAWQHHPTMRQAHAATVSARARSLELRGPLLPQFSANLGFNLGTQNIAGTTQDFTPTPNVSTGVTGSQLIYDFGKTWQRWKAAQASERAQESTEQASGQGVLFDVRTAYFSACANQALVEVAKQTLASQERHFNQIQGFVEVGNRPEIDLAQARTLRANARVQLISAQANADAARAQLNQAMGVERDTNFTVSDEVLPTVQGEQGAFDELLKEALAARPEFKALEEQLRAQELSIASVRGGYWPSLGVGAGLSAGGSRFDPPGVNWTAGATLRWDFFSGFQTQGQEGQAEAALDGLRAQVDAFRQQVRLAVERARLNVAAATEALVASEEARTSASVQLKLAEGRYQTGVGTVLELSDAQLAVTQSSAQVVQARFNLSTARAALLQALGRDGKP